MIVSVTVLGGAAVNGIGAIAAGIVRYLEEGRTVGGPRGGTVIELPSPTGGTVAYYADTKGTRPGRWAFGRSGDVEPDDLVAALSGHDPNTGAALVTRKRGTLRSVEEAPIILDPAREWFTTAETALALGVTPRYARRQLAKRAQLDVNGAGDCEVVQSPDRGWLIRRAALETIANDRRVPRVVVGYDLTLSVPKSVSVLWAGGDGPTRAAILASIDEAVAAGLRYADRHALVVRVRGEQVRADGVFAADYLHTTSRALEPQLHHHVVIANYGRAGDGQAGDGEWRALDARLLFAHAKTIGYLSGAELRHQLSARLGVIWGPIVNGVGDIEGIPKRALEVMSTRATELRAELVRLGLTDPATGISTASSTGRQIAVWATRAPKTHGVDVDELAAIWDERLGAVGFGAKERAAVLGDDDTVEPFTDLDRERLFAKLARVDGITASGAVFDRRTIVQHIAEEARERCSGDVIDHFADAFLARPEIVQLGATLDRTSRDVIRRADGRVVAIPVGERYSTRPMLALEARAVAMYERGRDANALVVDGQLLQSVFDDHRFVHLSTEQQSFVTGLVTSGLRIQGAVGPAGTGKTTALEAAVGAWERAGLRVLGTAVGGTQTVVLGEQAGIDATTVASVIARYYEQGDTRLLDARTVVLVDEASLLSTQDFALLASATIESGSILRLVGDPAQHSSVAAGGMFRFIVDHFGDEVPALTHIYRQEGPAMAEVRLANAEFRAGKIEEALERLALDGRIGEAGSADEAYDLLACAWYAERGQRITDTTRQRTSMTAEHHFERKELNARARALLIADGTLHGPALDVAGVTFQAGDEVITRVGDHGLRAAGAKRGDWVRNGARGVVQAIESDGLLVDFERWGRVSVPLSYIDQESAPGIRGGLQHAYALTTFAAQGETHAIAVPLLTDASTPEGAYVGITRGRFDLRAVVVRRRALSPPPTDDALPQLPDEATELEAATRRLENTVRETLATVVDADGLRVAELAATLSLARLHAAADSTADSDLYGRAARERARQVGISAIVSPSDAVLSYLGPRPTSGPERAVWDRAVSASAIWREREQVIADPQGPSATWALGARPTEPQRASDYDEINALIVAALAHDRHLDADDKGALSVHDHPQGPQAAELSDDQLGDRYRKTTIRWQIDEGELRRVDGQMAARGHQIAEHREAKGAVAVLERANDVDAGRRAMLAESVAAELRELQALEAEMATREIAAPEVPDETDVPPHGETEFVAPPSESIVAIDPLQQTFEL